MISHEFDIFIVTPRPQIAQNCRYPRQQPAVLGVEMITDGLLGQLTLGPGTANYVNNSAYREDESDNSIILSLGSPLAPLVSPGLPWSQLQLLVSNFTQHSNTPATCRQSQLMMIILIKLQF